MEEVIMPLSMPEIAAEVAKLFPELEGRAIAAMDYEISEEHVPTWPLAVVVAGAVGVGSNNWRNGSGNMEIYDDFQIEFWLKPERYKTKDGGESPFWAYYDYPSMLNRLLAGLLDVADRQDTLF